METMNIHQQNIIVYLIVAITLLTLLYSPLLSLWRHLFSGKANSGPQDHFTAYSATCNKCSIKTDFHS